MSDPRIERLAELLVGYSLDVREGHLLRIDEAGVGFTEDCPVGGMTRLASGGPDDAPSPGCFEEETRHAFFDIVPGKSNDLSRC